jgi:D-alanine-D-alanine ligase
MKICVLQPDYTTSDVDYKNYDPRRDLSPLLPDHHVDHVFLNKATTYRQLRALRRGNYDVFVNLCEGYLDWDIPSVDVILALEQLNLPYTGPTSRLYTLHSKALMKYVAYTQGVCTPNHLVARDVDAIDCAQRVLKYPLFVKPDGLGDSLGIDRKSLVHTPDALRTQAAEIIENYDQALIEEYIPGREYTVLIAGNCDDYRDPIVYRPLEFVFPAGESFKYYDLKVAQHRPECNVPCSDRALDRALRDAAQKIFASYGGLGYARVDFRVTDRGQIYFLEINFTCSVFYPEGHEGSADYILKYDGAGQAGFLRNIVAEGIARYKRRQKKYAMRLNSPTGYGIYATEAIEKNEVIYEGEGRAQRIVTRSHVGAHFTEEEQKVFRQYAYPLSDEVFVLWDEDPAQWAPQNHSCNPNTIFSGLNLVALRYIAPGEELTVDYATFCNEDMEPFDCRCQGPDCRGQIKGAPKNSVTSREKLNDQRNRGANWGRLTFSRE